MTDEREVLSERRGDVALLTLNRPHVLNALTVPMLGELSAAIRSHGAEGARTGWC